MIRKMQSTDLHRVAEIHVAAWRSAYDGVLPKERLDSLCVDDQEELWQSTLFRREGRTNLVCEEEGQVVGWCAIGPARDDDEDPRQAGEVYGVHVHPDFQRHQALHSDRFHQISG